MTVRVARGARRAVVLAAVLARFEPRVDRAAVLPFLVLVVLVALAALLAFAVRALVAFPAFAALRVRATAAVFFRAALFRAVLRARDFARIDRLFLVAAALRLAIAVVLSAAGLP